MGEYHDLYLTTDVFVLVDVFENFRNIFRETFDLDQNYYDSAPNLSWNAMLKTTDVELEVLTNVD